MAVRSIASLSISFGLISIPVKLYSATESSAAIRFKLMAPGGARLRQQYVAQEPAPGTPVAPEPEPEPEPLPRRRLPARDLAERVLDFPASRQEAAVAPEPTQSAPEIVERSDMVKGFEFEKGQFVLFSADELKALEEGSRQTIDIVSFIPQGSVDPLYYDKPYLLAPDRRGAKTYSLLLRAMRDTARCALAKWAWRSKEYVVQIRPTGDGLVLQQLLYADEVRSFAALDIDLVEVGEGELELARQLIGRTSTDGYDPTQFVDEEKKRILDAVARKIAGNEIVAPTLHQPTPEGNVVDLMAALRASLAQAAPVARPPRKSASNVLPLAKRKPARRASKVQAAVAAPARKSTGK